MDFQLTDEQQQLSDSIHRYLAENYPFEHCRKIKASAAGWDAQSWRGLADIGALALGVPAEQGGLGFGAVETMALMEACGRHLVLEPVLSSAIIATALLTPFATGAAVGDLLTDMAQGRQIAVLAHFEPGGNDAGALATRASLREGQYQLDGHKAVVVHAPAADVLLVSARLAGESRDRDTVALFRVPRETAGLNLQRYPTFDGLCAADVRLQEVRLPREARIGAVDALEAVEAALDVGIAGLCADAVGAMQALLEATVQYVRTRQQFGQPIGAFQAIQHRIAEMLIQVEQARSMSYLAALRCRHRDRSERRRALSAAKVLIGQAGRFVGQQAVQLHGGMGMTDELAVSHWFRRLTASDILFGDSDQHLARFSALDSGRAR